MNPDMSAAEEAGVENKLRRADDYMPVEVAGYSNGAARQSKIQTWATVVSPIVIVISLMWWGAKIDTGLDEARLDIAEIEAEAEAAAEDRRELAETQARISEALSETSTTLDRVNRRLETTREGLLLLRGAAEAE